MSHCGTVYVGETSQTVGSRTKEHITAQQTVYKHLLSNKNRTPSSSDINWKILHANINIQSINFSKFLKFKIVGII